MTDKFIQVAVTGNGELVCLTDTGKIWVRKYDDVGPIWCEISLPPPLEGYPHVQEC